MLGWRGMEQEKAKLGIPLWGECCEQASLPSKLIEANKDAIGCSSHGTYSYGNSS